jgi:serine/threonine protein kinase
MENKAAEQKYPILPSRYFVEGTLGSGAAGIVLRATEPQIQRTVAIKVLADTKSSTSEERFHREALLLSKLNHEHIVRIFSSGVSDEGNYYHVMEFLEGESLSQKLKSNPTISKEIFFDLFQQMFSALEYAHSMGIVHRDIKPSNIMLTNDPVPVVEGKCHAKLVDFGIGKELAEEGCEETRGLTKTGALLGTPLYMSPEQCRGVQASSQSDIYSMACIMYECLSGGPPFKGTNSTETMRCHLHDSPPPLAVPEDERDLAELVMRCLKKDPDQRPSAAAAREELIRIDQILHGKLLSKRSVLDYSPYAIAIITTVLLLVGLTWLLSSQRLKTIEATKITLQNESKLDKFQIAKKKVFEKLDNVHSVKERRSTANTFIKKWSDQADKEELMDRMPLIDAALALCQDTRNQVDQAIISDVYTKKAEALSWDEKTKQQAQTYYDRAVELAASLKQQEEEPTAKALAARSRFEFRSGRFEQFNKDLERCIPLLKERGMRQQAQQLVHSLVTEDLIFISNSTSSPQKRERYIAELMPHLIAIDTNLIDLFDERSRDALADTDLALKLLPPGSQQLSKFSNELEALRKQQVLN